VILNNHFHLLLKVEKDFVEFVQNLNGRISFEVNKLDGQHNRKVIYQYWDRCVRKEADFWKHFNYIHHNPVKHGLCKDEGEVFKYHFSGARQWVIIKGKEWIDSCFETYQIVDFTVGE
jgi:putative transposase